MPMIEVRDDRRRVIARIRVHGQRLVDITQIRRWTFADVRLVTAELTRLADRYETVEEVPPPLVTSDPQPVESPHVYWAEPPLHGPGSSRAAWVYYALAKGVKVTEDMRRDAIVAAVRGEPVGV
jgi:hypothetical protein